VRACTAGTVGTVRSLEHALRSASNAEPSPHHPEPAGYAPGAPGGVTAELRLPASIPAALTTGSPRRLLGPGLGPAAAARLTIDHREQGRTGRSAEGGGGGDSSSTLLSPPTTSESSASPSVCSVLTEASPFHRSQLLGVILPGVADEGEGEGEGGEGAAAEGAGYLPTARHFGVREEAVVVLGAYAARLCRVYCTVAGHELRLARRAGGHWAGTLGRRAWQGWTGALWLGARSARRAAAAHRARWLRRCFQALAEGLMLRGAGGAAGLRAAAAMPLPPMVPAGSSAICCLPKSTGATAQACEVMRRSMPTAGTRAVPALRSVAE
jgi:hypothetical protein